MAFYFKYRPVRLRSGKSIKRPIVPIIIEGKQDKEEITAMIDSGSDATIIPKEIAESIEIEYTGENWINGISGEQVNCKEGKAIIMFGKGREFYKFQIPVLIPQKEDLNLIIGRIGFFDQFKITFIESERKIEFKKIVENQF